VDVELLRYFPAVMLVILMVMWLTTAAATVFLTWYLRRFD
jgi:hypothetical protein